MSALRNYGHLVLHVTGLAAALAMAVVVIHRYNVRLDLTPDKRFTLSPHSTQIIDSIQQDVDVRAFVRREDPRNPYLQDLLWRVNARNPRIRYQLIDLNRSPSLARKYKVDAYGAVVAESRGKQKSFTNMREEILIAALLQVTRDYVKTVYFLTGHGEGDILNSDRHHGYTTAKVVLEQEFYTVKPLSLLGGQPVPPDAAVVVVAGARSDLLPQELLELGQYLERGGSVLAMVDPSEGRSLAAFLRRYRIDLPDEMVADRDFRLAAGEELTFRVRERPSDAVVARTLLADPVFSLARPIAEIHGDDDGGVVIRELLRTSQNSWGIPSGGKETDFEYDPERHRRGPFAVAIEATLPLRRGETSEDSEKDDESFVQPMERQYSRLIVFGDADFANNQFIEMLGNRDLLVNTVNWLALEESLVGVRSARKALAVEQFFVSSQQGFWAFLLGTVIQPSIFLALGIAVFVWRRVR